MRYSLTHLGKSEKMFYLILKAKKKKKGGER